MTEIDTEKALCRRDPEKLFPSVGGELGVAHRRFEFVVKDLLGVAAVQGKGEEHLKGDSHRLGGAGVAAVSQHRHDVVPHDDGRSAVLPVLPLSGESEGLIAPPEQCSRRRVEAIESTTVGVLSLVHGEKIELSLVKDASFLGIALAAEGESPLALTERLGPGGGKILGLGSAVLAGGPGVLAPETLPGDGVDAPGGEATVSPGDDDEYSPVGQDRR